MGTNLWYTNSGQNIDNATEIIERFGGIRPMAKKIGVAVTTIQGGKNGIPFRQTAEGIC